jgi:hypothetical protein
MLSRPIPHEIVLIHVQLHATVRYSIDGFVGAEKLWEYPTWSHGIMQYLIPEVRQVHQYLANGSR